MQVMKRALHLWTAGSAVFALAFLLNFAWEAVHAVLFYEAHADFAAGFFTRMALYAAFIDALIIFGIFAAGCLLFTRKGCWLEHYRGREVGFTILAGIIIAAVIEIKALLLGQWQYNELMPRVFGLGLSPLVQLAVTGALSMYGTAVLLYARKKT